MVVALLVSGFLHAKGIYTLMPGITDLASIGNWIRTGVVLAALFLLPLQAMLAFVQEISHTARSRAVALANVEQEQARHLEADQAKRQAQEDARRAQRQKIIGRMAGGLAHEINGALQEIEGWLELIERALPRDASEGREALAQMDLSAERAAAIGRRLLLVGGAHVSQKERTDLHAFLESLRGTLAAVLGYDRELELAPSGTFFATLDPVELAHVLVNLAANARDAMSGGGRLTVVLREPTAEERTQIPDVASAIDVTDTGTGMTPEFARKIFDPFFSTKGAGGTGLGLASVKQLVEGAGGRVTVQSELGHGTTFTVLLPAGDATQDSGIVTAASSADLPTESSADGPLVLFVEDEAGIRQVFERLLVQSGLRLDVAADVDAAIACLERRVPDLVWTDAVLPGRPTRDLIAEVRRIAPEVPVVVCSGHVAEELLRRDLRAGGLEFVPKPYSAGQVVERARLAAAERRGKPSATSMTGTEPR
jgi:signal transduction histidine kinase/CheY-like chemotaxis protein